MTLVLVSLIVGIAFSYEDYDIKTKAYELTMSVYSLFDLNFLTLQACWEGSARQKGKSDRCSL